MNDSWRSSVHFMAFGFGAGYSPVAPGTMGTLVGIPLYLIMQPLPLWEYLGLVLGMFLLGIWICDVATARLGVHDHPGIVWDEIVGYLVVMAAAPAGWQWVLLGFVLFRFFDILKPWPIKAIDCHVKGGFGVMLDDLLAGLFGLIVLQAVAMLVS